MKDMTQEDKRRQKAYKETRSDVQASSMLGLKITTFKMWRRKHGLKARSSVGRPQVIRSTKRQDTQ